MNLIEQIFIGVFLLIALGIIGDLYKTFKKLDDINDSLYAIKHILLAEFNMEE